MNVTEVSSDWCARYQAALNNEEERESLMTELFSQFKTNYTHSIDYEALKNEMLQLIEANAAPLVMNSVSSELIYDFIESVLKNRDVSQMRTIALFCFYQLLRHTTVKKEENV